MLIERNNTGLKPRYIFLNIDQKFNSLNSHYDIEHNLDHLNKILYLDFSSTAYMGFNYQEFKEALEPKKSFFKKSKPDLQICLTDTFWVKELSLCDFSTCIYREGTQNIFSLSLKFSFETLTIC